METELRVLVTLGFTLLLILLRLDAEKFGAADYQETGADDRPPPISWRLAWYLTGLVLLIGADIVHPDAGTGLLLRSGNLLEGIVYGLIFGAVGTLQAAAFVWLRDGGLRLPPNRFYPGALGNAVATAFFDETVFRGLLLAFLLGAGIDGWAANLVQALTYALATRLGARGRDPYVLGLILILGLFSGWLTIITGGIAAAFLGHAITRFAVYVVTGTSGGLAAAGGVSAGIASRRERAAGWRAFGAEDSSFEG